MTYQEIKAFDCGTKTYPVYPNQQKIKTHKPLLSEVFQLVKSKNSKVKFNIEIKADSIYDDVYTPKPNEFVSLVLELINEYDVFELTNLQSFDLRILEEVKRQSPNMEVALLVDEFEEIESKLSRLSYTPEIISPYFKLLDDAAFFAVHSIVTDVFVLTTSFNINLIRPVSSGVITAKGKVTRCQEIGDHEFEISCKLIEVSSSS